MVYLLKMVIFHGYVSHNHMVNFNGCTNWKCDLPHGRGPGKVLSPWAWVTGLFQPFWAFMTNDTFNGLV